MKKKDFNSSKNLSQFWKHLSFISRQRYHKRHKDTIFKATALRVPADLQQASKSTTRPGITQDNLNSTNNLTMKKKVIRRHPILFAHNTSINHNDVLLQRLSMVRIFPRVTGHTKNYFNGTLVFQALFQRKHKSSRQPMIL